MSTGFNEQQFRGKRVKFNIQRNCGHELILSSSVLSTWQRFLSSDFLFPLPLIMLVINPFCHKSCTAAGYFLIKAENFVLLGH
jgi:hypothetical protein